MKNEDGSFVRSGLPEKDAAKRYTPEMSYHTVDLTEDDYEKAMAIAGSTGKQNVLNPEMIKPLNKYYACVFSYYRNIEFRWQMEKQL